MQCNSGMPVSASAPGHEEKVDDVETISSKCTTATRTPPVTLYRPQVQIGQQLTGTCCGVLMLPGPEGRRRIGEDSHCLSIFEISLSSPLKESWPNTGKREKREGIKKGRSSGYVVKMMK